MFGSSAYPTYQVFLAVGVAALVTGLLMPLFIKLMRYEGVGQQIRADGPQRHLVKQGTPTMGGVIILVGVLLTCVFLAQWSPKLALAVGAMLVTGSLGLLDDIESVAHGRSLGLTPSQKMAGLILISVIFCLVAVNVCGIAPTVSFPGGWALDLGVLTTELEVGGTTVAIPWLYLVFVFLLMAGLSNAVNLTDGLDGLAGGCTTGVMLFMAMVAFRYNELDLAIFAAAIAGACVGFLWHNCYPASIFSLIMGGLFIVEALSVMIQVVSFKLTGKRVFLMAPIHHHFEKLGWKENKVVVRFWIVSAAFAALGFALYFQLG